MKKTINDPLLKGEYLEFSIDSINNIDGEEYLLNIIPNIESKYFPPFHLRNIVISERYVDYNFLNYHFKKKNNESLPTNNLSGSAKQGGFYRCSTDLLIETKAFSGEQLQMDIFTNNYVTEIPFRSNYGNNIRPFDQLEELFKGFNIDGELNNGKSIKLYCFNVGQGDSLLLITNNGQAFLIDMNIYNKKSNEKFAQKIKKILNENKIKDIEGLIITHKHIDHYRGAAEFLNTSGIIIKNLLMNFDYDHRTKALQDFLNTAETKIPNWYNINVACNFPIGEMNLCFVNPTHDTATAIMAPDINDSSICLCLTYGAFKVCLTGDTSSDILINKYHCAIKNQIHDCFLKVAHHGSRTGTNDNLINLIKAKHAFISAGNSKKYGHPHKETLDSLSAQGIIPLVSKDIQKDVLVIISQNEIQTHFV